MPKEIRCVLEEYQDIMHAKLPSKLPPRREVDHKIELESGIDLQPWVPNVWHYQNWKNFKSN